MAWYDLVMRRLAEGHPSSRRTTSTVTSTYPYPPSAHWITIILDMYLEPIAECIVSKSLFVSRTSVALSYGRHMFPALFIYSVYIFIWYAFMGYGWIGSRWSVLVELTLACIFSAELVVMRKIMRVNRALR